MSIALRCCSEVAFLLAVGIADMEVPLVDLKFLLAYFSDDELRRL